MRIIAKVITGSKLHGLDTPKSDTDYRGIFMHPLIDVLSPFHKVKTTSWIEGDKNDEGENEDNTAYEIRHFVQMATKGNPSALEVLWSNMIIQTSDEFKYLYENRHKFLDSKYIFEAHRGYATNQYNKMNLFSPDERTPKFAVAYVRVLQQGIELLKTGEFSPQVVRNKDFLYEVKNNFNKEKHVTQLGKLFSELQVEIADAYYKNQNKFIVDEKFFEQFIYVTYTR